MLITYRFYETSLLQMYNDMTQALASVILIKVSKFHENDMQ